MKSSLRLFLSLVVVLTLGSCKRKSSSTATTSQPNSSSWLSSFSTISTGVTNATSGYMRISSGKDASGDIYLSGATTDGWLVLKSSDQGVTWAQDALVTGTNAYGVQIVGDSLGNVFNVGNIGQNGVIRKRDATTHTWSTVYSGQINPGYRTRFAGVAVDSLDNIYVSGSAFLHLISTDAWPDTGLDEWVVLKSTDHGTTWDLVDTYHPSDQAYGYPQGIFIASWGSIYAYGMTSDSSGYVRKSADGGSTWNTVYEDIQCPIRGMAEWNSGLVISEECYLDGATAAISQLRGTTDDFVHMKTLDQYDPSGSSALVTGSVHVDSRNYIYYSAYWYDSSETHLVFRVNRGDGNWTTIDDYKTDAIDVGGSFFDTSTGVFNAGITSTTWVIRKAMVSTADTFTPASMANGTDFESPLPAGTKRVFTTWARHDGNFGANPAAALAAADAFCNADQRKPLYNPSATYKAMLVNSLRRACTTPNCMIGGASENLDWVFAPSTTYVTYEGTTLFTTDASGIFNAVHQSPIKISVDYAWTGLHTNVDWTNETTCLNWTTNNGNGDDWASAWDLHGPTFEDIYLGYYAYCDASMPLICVEQ